MQARKIAVRGQSAWMIGQGPEVTDAYMSRLTDFAISSGHFRSEKGRPREGGGLCMLERVSASSR
jgi:hypothetical protein